MGGKSPNVPCTGVKASEEANPEVAVPAVLMDASRPLFILESLAVLREELCEA